MDQQYARTQDCENNPIACNTVSSKKKQVGKTGAKYCSAINCSNNARTIDERTGQQVRMHRFPDPVKQRDR